LTSIIVSFIIAAIIIIAVAYHKLGPYHFRIITPGVLYRAGNQRGYTLRHLVNKYQIKTIVSLRTINEGGRRPDWFNEETSFCRENNIQFFHISMLGKTPPTPEQIHRWLSIVQDSANHPILVHCAEGVARTGYMIAIYQIAVRGMDNLSAWKSLHQFGHKFERNNYRVMKDFILNFTCSPQQESSSADPKS
jgi:protein tyrosine phosphatase (PTP) superfamily phosphohydrolase (DUF442 family)